MIKYSLIIITLFFSSAACTEENKINEFEKKEIEYQKRVEKSCVRINKMHNYYLEVLNNDKTTDKEIRILIERQRKMTKSFLFKYNCSRFNIKRYGTIVRPYIITNKNIKIHKTLTQLIQAEIESLIITDIIHIRKHGNN